MLKIDFLLNFIFRNFTLQFIMIDENNVLNKVHLQRQRQCGFDIFLFFIYANNVTSRQNRSS